MKYFGIKQLLSCTLDKFHNDDYFAVIMKWKTLFEESPKEGERVLTLACRPFPDDIEIRYFCFNKFWQQNQLEPDADQLITHWMPLPEVPK